MVEEGGERDGSGSHNGSLYFQTQSSVFACNLNKPSDDFGNRNRQTQLSDHKQKLRIASNKFCQSSDVMVRFKRKNHKIADHSVRLFPLNSKIIIFLQNDLY